MVVPAAAAELAPGNAAGHLDGPVVRVHLWAFLTALQALRTVVKSGAKT